MAEKDQTLPNQSFSLPPSASDLLICLRNMLMQSLLSKEGMNALCMLVCFVSLYDLLKSFCRRRVLLKDISTIFDLTQAVFLDCD